MRVDRAKMSVATVQSSTVFTGVFISLSDFGFRISADEQDSSVMTAVSNKYKIIPITIYCSTVVLYFLVNREYTVY